MKDSRLRINGDAYQTVFLPVMGFVAGGREATVQDFCALFHMLVAVCFRYDKPLSRYNEQIFRW